MITNNSFNGEFWQRKKVIFVNESVLLFYKTIFYKQLRER